MKLPEALACEPGYTPYFEVMSIDGCKFGVDICVKCSPLGLAETKVKISHVEAYDCPLQADILDEIRFKISHPANAKKWCIILADVPPCPEQTQGIEVITPKCWYAKIVEYLGRDLLYYHECEDNHAYCHEIYKWCWDSYGQTYWKFVDSFSGEKDQNKPDACTLEMEEIDIPTKRGDVTPCFEFPTLCRKIPGW